MGVFGVGWAAVVAVVVVVAAALLLVVVCACARMYVCERERGLLRA